jgi:hypothetical protein
MEAGSAPLQCVASILLIDEYLALFSGANLERARFVALATAVLRQVTDLMALVQGMPEAYSLPCAVGSQLDCLAATLGLTRVDSPQGAAATDAEFQAFIQDKLALWRTDGTNGSS